MKRYALYWLVFSTLALVLTIPARAAEPEAGQSGTVRLKIIQTIMPVFPPALIEDGYTTGMARIIIAVDETGKLTDWLVTAYTHRAFADATINAIKAWKYEVTLVNGQPRGIIRELTFNYEVDGVIVRSISTAENVSDLIMKNTRDREKLVYKTRKPEELDRLPKPKRIIQPVYYNAWAAKGLVGDVRVDFYVDENGQVRIPFVDNAAPDQLAIAALTAVEQWKFEPALYRGKPALVHVSQIFKFAGPVPRSSAPTANSAFADTTH
jgi:TonB family protein